MHPILGPSGELVFGGYWLVILGASGGVFRPLGRVQFGEDLFGGMAFLRYDEPSKNPMPKADSFSDHL